MGWKRIGNHSYFYRSRRQGGRVVSDYFGRGELGTLSARLAQLDRQERDEQRAEEKAEREAAEREERAIAEWFEAVEDVATAAMLAAGFHKHHGQWRRKRDGGDEWHGGAHTPRDGGGQAPGEDDVG
jgi:hypothetical protein